VLSYWRETTEDLHCPSAQSTTLFTFYKRSLASWLGRRIWMQRQCDVAGRHTRLEPPDKRPAAHLRSGRSTRSEYIRHSPTRTCDFGEITEQIFGGAPLLVDAQLKKKDHISDRDSTWRWNDIRGRQFREENYSV
jgi:hypothetical protein